MKIRGLPLTSLAKLINSKRLLTDESPRSVFICIADHYEPDWGKATEWLRAKRVERWLDEYPKSVDGIEDCRGRNPQHTFFYPLEEYRSNLLDKLASLCHAGFGDVEVHLHHHNDNSNSLHDKLIWFKNTLYDNHNLLRKDQSGDIRYGFIHGNWALCNSRADGKWCGVNDEINVLLKTGCYADFTMPSAPDPTQTRSINRIYYAFSDASQPKSHDWGPAARVGCNPPDNGLLMIPGPLSLDFKKRKWNLLPRIENGDLHADRPPSIERLDLWENAEVSVEGKSDWIFCKLHTHGAKEENAAHLLGESMRRFHEALAIKAKQNSQFKYFYVTAYEMAELVHAAEAGCTEPDEILNQLENKSNPGSTLLHNLKSKTIHAERVNSLNR
ncbi:MAG: hypothetical protein COA78_06070 [Blastopirellula sp.]|nr:MAG: hypothetical protein COA78_06070 [Blastopirellula sp.]